VFQEQVIKVGRDIGGFTPGKGELLRRALGSKNALEAIERFHVEFLEGAHRNGVTAKTAEAIWKMIAGFAGYSFSKAHAAAFAVIVYWSAWLRVHYPTEYFCGLLRNTPLGTYPANVLESEARRAGVKFLPFDINHSLAKPTVQNGAIRFGLGYVKGIGETTADDIVQMRGARPFRSLADFIERARLDRRSMEWLILAGAFDAFGERRQLLWNLAEAFDIVQRPAMLPLQFIDEQVALEPMTDEQRLVATFAATGVTAGMSLVEVRRDAFTKAGCAPLSKLRKMRMGTRVKVGGLIADGVRRPPTAKGTAFIRLEEPYGGGMIDVIIPQEVYLQHRDVLGSAFVVMEGVLKANGVTVSVAAKRIEVL